MALSHIAYFLTLYSPWPQEGQEFSTLWCRMISASCAEWKFKLRDYPQSLLDMSDLEIWGRLIGAEQKASKRGIMVFFLKVFERSYTCIMPVCLFDQSLG